MDPIRVMTTDSPLGRVKDGEVDLNKLRVQQTWWVAPVSMTQELRGIVPWNFYILNPIYWYF